MSDREEFQKWLLNEHWFYSRWQEDRNCYADFPAHLAWKAWQAARAQSGQGDGRIKCSESQRDAINHALDVLSKHGDSFTSVGAMQVLEEMLAQPPVERGEE